MHVSGLLFIECRGADLDGAGLQQGSQFAIQ